LITQLPLPKVTKLVEVNTIQEVLKNNRYNNIQITNPPPQHKEKLNTQQNDYTHKMKWMIFTMSGEEIRQITKLFKNIKNRIPHRLYNREYSDANNTNRQIQRKLHLPN
jgi:hypothetical protein